MHQLNVYTYFFSQVITIQHVLIRFIFKIHFTCHTYRHECQTNIPHANSLPEPQRAKETSVRNVKHLHYICKTLAID